MRRCVKALARSINVKWKAKDEIDANSFLEHHAFKSKAKGGFWDQAAIYAGAAVEVVVGDIIGDKVLDTDFPIEIHVDDKVDLIEAKPRLKETWWAHE
jgi:hypothetical protein